MTELKTMAFRIGATCLVGMGLVLSNPTIGQACGIVLKWKAEMKSSKIVPPVKSASTAVAQLKWRFPQQEATVFVTSQKVQDVTAAELHVAAQGQNGPAIFTLYSPSKGPWTNRLAADINPAQLQPHPEVGIKTYTDAVNAIAAGKVYVTIATKEHPAGELRGQIQIIRQLVYSKDSGGFGHDPKLHHLAQASSY